MATQASLGGSFDLGRVLSRSFQAIGNQFAVFVTLSILLAGIPAAVMQIWQPATDDPAAALAAITSFGFWASLIVSLLFSFVLQAALVRATILDLRSEPVELVPLLGRALMLALPMIGLTIIYSLGVGLGMILLIVPGLILLIMWVVAVPVLVTEDRGVFGSLGRSAELTKGYRWWIFLLGLIVIVASLIVGAVLGAVTGLAGPGIFALLITVVTSTLSGMIYASIIAALYVELRMLQEGGSSDRLAAIFD